MKKELVFAALMAASLGVDKSELLEGFCAFAEDAVQELKTDEV